MLFGMVFMTRYLIGCRSFTDDKGGITQDSVMNSLLNIVFCIRFSVMILQ